MLYESISIWGLITSIIIGLVFYLYNWEKRKKWYIIVASIILILVLIIIFNQTGWFSISH